TVSATGTIFDNDGPPTLSVQGTTVPEGTGGPTVATPTVRLLPADTNPTTFHYSTTDGAAKAPADYTATSGDATITAGETTATIEVPITPASADEADEDFSVALT